MNELPIEAIFSRLLGHLESAGIPYMIMGGMAVRALGVPRPTYDGDLTVDPTEEQFDALIRRIEPDGFSIPDEFRKGYRDSLAGMKKVSLNYFENGHAWTVDVFMVTTEYQKAAFQRRRTTKFLGGERALISSEDLVLHKLVAWRPKDRADIHDLIVLHRPLDEVYMKHWASKLRVPERLEEALKQAEE